MFATGVFALSTTRRSRCQDCGLLAVCFETCSARFNIVGSSMFCGREVISGILVKNHSRSILFGLSVMGCLSFGVQEMELCRWVLVSVDNKTSSAHLDDGRR